jgi:hypothetical protein
MIFEAPADEGRHLPILVTLVAAITAMAFRDGPRAGGKLRVGVPGVA